MYNNRLHLKLNGLYIKNVDMSKRNVKYHYFSVCIGSLRNELGLFLIINIMKQLLIALCFTGFLRYGNRFGEMAKGIENLLVVRGWSSIRVYLKNLYI